MKRIYKLSELEMLPTLSVSQADDLKIDDGETRIWLSRCTVEDGEPYNNKVTVETLKAGYTAVSREAYERRHARGRWEAARWVVDYTYQAK